MSNGQTLDDLLSRVRSQVKAVETLSQVLTAEKEGLRRIGRAAQLDAVRHRVKREVAFEQSMEAASRSGYNEGKVVGALAMFGLGVFKANTGQVNQEPVVAGICHSMQYLRKTEPFGTVMVSVGSRGLFGDVTVLSISSMARDQGRPESEVVAAVMAKGRELMTPEAFFRLLDAQRQKVLTGPTEPVLMAPGPEEQPGNKHAEHRQLSE